MHGLIGVAENIDPPPALNNIPGAPPVAGAFPTKPGVLPPPKIFV